MKCPNALIVILAGIFSQDIVVLIAFLGSVPTNISNFEIIPKFLLILICKLSR
jgi:hypothetical protein